MNCKIRYSKQFCSNCLVEAIVAWMKHPLTTKIKGSVCWRKLHFHFQWIRNGFVHDFCESNERVKNHPRGFYLLFNGRIRTFEKRYTKYLIRNNIWV